MSGLCSSLAKVCHKQVIHQVTTVNLSYQVNCVKLYLFRHFVTAMFVFQNDKVIDKNTILLSSQQNINTKLSLVLS